MLEKWNNDDGGHILKWIQSNIRISTSNNMDINRFLIILQIYIYIYNRNIFKCLYDAYMNNIWEHVLYCDFN